MQKLKKIKKFIFDKAQYQVSDSYGNSGLLQVDYKRNSYKLVGAVLEENAEAEIKLFAQELLERKHGKNFAQDS